MGFSTAAEFPGRVGRAVIIPPHQALGKLSGAILNKGLASRQGEGRRTVGECAEGFGGGKLGFHGGGIRKMFLQLVEPAAYHCFIKRTTGGAGEATDSLLLALYCHSTAHLFI